MRLRLWDRAANPNGGGEHGGEPRTSPSTIAGREAAAADGWERVWGTASGSGRPDDGVVGLDARPPVDRRSSR